jgi:hypothetical protein
MLGTCFGPDALTGAIGAGAEFRELDSAKTRPLNPHLQDCLVGGLAGDHLRDDRS